MRVNAFLDPQSILLDAETGSKSEAIALAVKLLLRSNADLDSSELEREVLKREGQGTTAIGKGVAIPHARLKTASRIAMALLRLNKGIDFAADDGEAVRLIFLTCTPEEKVSEYLKVLARLAKILKVTKIRKRLMQAVSAQEVIEILDEAEI